MKRLLPFVGGMAVLMMIGLLAMFLSPGTGLAQEATTTFPPTTPPPTTFPPTTPPPTTTIPPTTTTTLSIPAIGLNNAGGNRSVTTEISAGGEFGHLRAAWYSNGQKNLSVSGINPDGGIYGGAFDCQFWGYGNVTMPTYQRIGLDRATMSASIPWTEFDYCVGDYPDVITYDIEILAATVYKEVHKEHRTVLKGDGYESKSTSTWLSGSGDGDGTVTGVFQGEHISGWASGYYSFGGYNQGGGPTTTLAP